MQLVRLAALAVCLLLPVAQAIGQASPPGPTAPAKPLPVPKPGEDLVINPTIDDCKAGWRPGLRWTKTEFERFCHQLKISK